MFGLPNKENPLKEWEYLIDIRPPTYKKSLGEWNKLNEVRRKVIWKFFYNTSQRKRDQYFNLFKRKGDYWDFDFQSLSFKQAKNKRPIKKQIQKQIQKQKTVPQFIPSKEKVDPQFKVEKSKPIRIVNNLEEDTNNPKLDPSLEISDFPIIDMEIVSDDGSDTEPIEKRKLNYPLIISSGIVSLIMLKTLFK